MSFHKQKQAYCFRTIFSSVKQQSNNVKKGNEKKSPFLRYAAIGIIGIAFLGTSYYFSDRYVTEQRVVEQEKAQIQIEKNLSLTIENLDESEKEIKPILDQLNF